MVLIPFWSSSQEGVMRVSQPWWSHLTGAVTACNSHGHVNVGSQTVESRNKYHVPSSDSSL